MKYLKHTDELYEMIPTFIEMTFEILHCKIEVVHVRPHWWLSKKFSCSERNSGDMIVSLLVLFTFDNVFPVIKFSCFTGEYPCLQVHLEFKRKFAFYLEQVSIPLVLNEVSKLHIHHSMYMCVRCFNTLHWDGMADGSWPTAT